MNREFLSSGTSPAPPPSTTCLPVNSRGQIITGGVGSVDQYGSSRGDSGPFVRWEPQTDEAYMYLSIALGTLLLGVSVHAYVKYHLHWEQDIMVSSPGCWTWPRPSILISSSRAGGLTWAFTQCEAYCPFFCFRSTSGFFLSCSSVVPGWRVVLAKMGPRPTGTTGGILPPPPHPRLTTARWKPPRRKGWGRKTSPWKRNSWASAAVTATTGWRRRKGTQSWEGESVYFFGLIVPLSVRKITVSRNAFYYLFFLNLLPFHDMNGDRTTINIMMLHKTFGLQTRDQKSRAISNFIFKVECGPAVILPILNLSWGSF